jgi:hypothetical protein
MTKFLLIVLLIAVIAGIGVLVARSRASSADALPPEDHPDALEPPRADDTVTAPPPADITTSATAPSPLPPEPVPEWVEQAPPPSEPEVQPETVPPMEPEPGVEPLPEPDPIVEPEPVIEPDTAGVGSPVVDHPAADPDEPTDPPRAVIDAGETAAKELDPEAGWESDDDQTIHADPESGLYHTPDSPGYLLGPDGQVFESEEEAQQAGFTRWDQPDESS